MNELSDKNNRLRNLIVTDRRENPIKIEKFLKAEIIKVLQNFFDIATDDVSLSIIISKEGIYDIQINALSKNFLNANVFA